MSGKGKPPVREERLDRFEAALAAEREARAADRKDFEDKRKADRKDFEDKRKADRKDFEDKRKADRRDWAVKIGEISSMWGQLAEFVIKSGILATLDGHAGISVDDLVPNVDVYCPQAGGEDEYGEIDIVASGERDIVVVETKVTMHHDDIGRFVDKYLRNFPRWKPCSQYILLPACRGKRVFGCLAYAKANASVEKTAVKAGLITVHVFGDSSKLAHPDTELTDFHL